MTDIPFYWLDVFTSEPFKGNPAAVCIMKTDRQDSLYQNIAGELGLAETAFAEKIGPSLYKLRWFTPELEASLCGHATMATAYTLAKEHRVKSPIVFHTKSGSIKAEVSRSQATLEFPSFSIEKTDDERILEPLGIEDCVELRYTPASAIPKFTVILENQEQVRELWPDFSRLKELGGELGFKGVIVTGKGEAPYDYVYRTFAPGAGIDEDQGTGSVHCVIASYWRNRLGKTEMRSLQLSERGSEMIIRVVEDGVRITGSVRLLIRGTLSI
jgi:PhzF family phenazine biosynthesis protein